MFVVVSCPSSPRLMYRKGQWRCWVWISKRARWRCSFAAPRTRCGWRRRRLGTSCGQRCRKEEEGAKEEQEEVKKRRWCFFATGQSRAIASARALRRTARWERAARPTRRPSPSSKPAAAFFPRGYTTTTRLPPPLAPLLPLLLLLCYARCVFRKACVPTQSRCKRRSKWRMGKKCPMTILAGATPPFPRFCRNREQRAPIKNLSTLLKRTVLMHIRVIGG